MEDVGTLPHTHIAPWRDPPPRPGRANPTGARYSNQIHNRGTPKAESARDPPATRRHPRRVPVQGCAGARATATGASLLAPACTRRAREAGRSGPGSHARA